MLTQTLLTGALVLISALYASWMLMPTRLKRGLAKRLLHLSWPARLQRFWQHTAQAAGGCGSCHGCETPPSASLQATPQDAWQPVQLHQRRSPSDAANTPPP
jgi:cytochrome c553